MSKFHEYLNLDRWDNYKEERGNTGYFVYTLPSYRFDRIFSEIQSLKAENEKLTDCILNHRPMKIGNKIYQTSWHNLHPLIKGDENAVEFKEILNRSRQTIKELE